MCCFQLFTVNIGFYLEYSSFCLIFMLHKDCTIQSGGVRMSELLEILFHSSPLICGFLSLSIGGLILDTTVSDPNLVGIVVYTPVINGKTWRYCLMMMSLLGALVSSCSIHFFLQTQDVAQSGHSLPRSQYIKHFWKRAVAQSFFVTCFFDRHT